MPKELQIVRLTKNLNPQAAFRFKTRQRDNQGSHLIAAPGPGALILKAQTSPFAALIFLKPKA